MTAVYRRRCGTCNRDHVCGDSLRSCFCPWCDSGEVIETVAVTPHPEYVAAMARRGWGAWVGGDEP